jgi:glycine/D-amino acid oxidase-like deaminating enzyme
MQGRIGRRRFLRGAAAAATLGALHGCRLTPAASREDSGTRLQLSPIRASVDRITRVTVCTRPFRAAGPRLDVEKVGAKTVVHNYGHGGSGWSLSWGSGAIATAHAMATGERDIAVVGCGALGITTALLLQRAGARVIIYAKDLPPNVRSAFATGLYTPDSRICLEEHAGGNASHPARWAAGVRGAAIGAARRSDAAPG